MDRAISLDARRIDLTTEPPFQLGAVRIDPRSHEIAWNGELRRIQPQTLKVLVALHDRNGEVVTRDELVDRCWDGRFIGHDVINRSVSLLRGLSAESGGFEIETVPKAGYRLVQSTERSAWAPNQLLKAGVRRPLVADRRVVLGGIAALAAAASTGWLMRRPKPGPPLNRIAVLPFANLTGDPSEAYFSDGIAEELRASLSRVGMQVIGRTSSEAVRNMDTKTAAATLGVQNILTGSVRRSPGKIRIDAQLLQGSDGVERWSQSYDRAPGDVIDIQTDIAEKVAFALSTALGNAERHALVAGGTRNPRAHMLMLQALAAARAGTQIGCEWALKLLDEAIAADGSYGDAYARKAYYLEFYVEYYATTLAEMNAYRSEALQCARTALRLAPNLSRAHWALAQYLGGVLDIAGADAEFRKAIHLAPGDAGPLSDYSLLVVRIGSPTQALTLADLASHSIRSTQMLTGGGFSCSITGESSPRRSPFRIKSNTTRLNCSFGRLMWDSR